MGFRWQLWQPYVCNMRLTSVQTWALWWRLCNLFWLWGPHSRQNMEVNRIALFWSPLICCAVCIDCKQMLVLLQVGEKGNISYLCMQLPSASNSCVPTHRQTLVTIWCQFALCGFGPFSKVHPGVMMSVPIYVNNDVAAQWQHSWFADQTVAAIAGAVFWSQCRVYWKFSVCSTENLSWWQFVSLFLCYFCSPGSSSR